MHFTYQRPEGDLRQGDLLQITPEIKGVLSKFHPYFSDHPDYPFLIVLTQSCDLERRDGKCKSRYITLAAVRPLDTLIDRELKKHQQSSIEVHNKFCSSDRRRLVRDFLVKLYNNNLEDYFFLAPSSEFEIQDPLVAFLMLSVPIKAEHYKKCLSARIAQLKEIFRAKLGWLVGNIYSRVATPDWVPAQIKQPEKFDSLIDDILNDYAVWVDKPILKKLKAEQNRRRKERGDKKYRIPQAEINELMKLFIQEEEKRRERFVDLIVSLAKDTLPGIREENLTTLKAKLINNESLNEYLF
ncbi:MAG: hypothetical protein ACE5D6_09780 [Candidatus Zixiibacteriota bacterium]